VAVVAWLGVVIAGSTMTWATINTAGQEVLSPRTVPTPTANGEPLLVQDPVTVRPSPEDSETTGPGPRRTPSPTPDEETTRSPDGEPSAAPSPEPTAEPPPSPAPAPPPAPRAFTWRGTAGSVTVACDGSTISLQAASPANGFTVDVREAGPEKVDVRLEAEDEEADVDAECESGQAVFDVNT
jgi:hypothetical protein